MVSKTYCNCCRWTKQDRYFSRAIENLRKEKDFCDVTLACGDEQLKAHKVILSACSPLFNRILKRNPHPHPLIYIPGAKYANLQALLDFMYLGQVEVSGENQDSFLELAKELQVEALYQFLINDDDSWDNFGSDKRRSCDENNTRNSDENKRSNSDKDESSKCNKDKRSNSDKDKGINRDKVEVRIHDKDKIINCDTVSELPPTTTGTKSSTNDIPALKRPLTQNDQQPPSKRASISTPVSAQQDTPEMTERSELNEEGGTSSSSFVPPDLTLKKVPRENQDQPRDSAPGSTLPSTGNVHTDAVTMSVISSDALKAKKPIPPSVVKSFCIDGGVTKISEAIQTDSNYSNDGPSAAVTIHLTPDGRCGQTEVITFGGPFTVYIQAKKLWPTSEDNLELMITIEDLNNIRWIRNALHTAWLDSKDPKIAYKWIKHNAETPREEADALEEEDCETEISCTGWSLRLNMRPKSALELRLDTLLVPVTLTGFTDQAYHNNQDIRFPSFKSTALASDSVRLLRCENGPEFYGIGILPFLSNVRATTGDLPESYDVKMAVSALLRSAQDPQVKLKYDTWNAVSKSHLPSTKKASTMWPKPARESALPPAGLGVNQSRIRNSGQPYLDDTNDGDTKTRGVEAQEEPNISNDNGGLDDLDRMNVQDGMNYEDGDRNWDAESDTESSDTSNSNSGTAESYGDAADEIKRIENFMKENLEINAEHYSCKICMKIFPKNKRYDSTVKWNARRHIHTVHYGEEKICLMCGIIFKNHSSLSEHHRRGKCNHDKPS